MHPFQYFCFNLFSNIVTLLNVWRIMLICDSKYFNILNNLGSTTNIVLLCWFSIRPTHLYTHRSTNMYFVHLSYFTTRQEIVMRFIFGEQQGLHRSFTTRSSRDERGRQSDRPVLLESEILSFNIEKSPVLLESKKCFNNGQIVL